MEERVLCVHICVRVCSIYVVRGKAPSLDIARTAGYRCEILVGDNPEESRQQGDGGRKKGGRECEGR